MLFDQDFKYLPVPVIVPQVPNAATKCVTNFFFYYFLKKIQLNSQKYKIFMDINNI